MLISSVHFNDNFRVASLENGKKVNCYLEKIFPILI